MRFHLLGAAALACLALPAQAVTVIGATKIIVSNFGDFLQVAEVVATKLGSGLDVAASTNGGSANATSQYDAMHGADKAIDGITGGDFSTDKMYHALTDSAADVLTVNFAATTLASLTLYGRTDSYAFRDLYKVSIFDAAGSLLYSGKLDARSGPATVTFDAPAVGGVPEPTTWALLAAGFGLIGAAARRRTAAAVAV